MATDTLCEGWGRESARGDVGSPFGLDFVAALDAALDHGDGGDFSEAGSARIAALGSVPVNNVGNCMEADLETAVVLANGFDLLDVAGRCGVEIALDIVMEGPLAVLDGPQIVGPRAEDRL